MKSLLLALAFLLLSFVVYAQLNTFSEGDVISAEKMNENFEYLEQQFRGSRATTVDCGTSGTGSGINEAIAQGFNDITVSGTCNENLLYTVWRDDKQDGEYQPSNKLAPRYLRISGTSADSKIVDASSKSENTISVNSGSTLFLENITVSGGRRGIVAVRNSNLLLSGVRIENFSQRGIRVDDSSYLGVDAGGVTIIGAEGAEYGVYLATGSSGWIQKAEISNVQRGISLFGGSFLYLNDFVIDATSIGIWQTDHTTIVKNGGKGIIRGTLEKALRIHRANFYNWDSGTLEIKDVRGGYGIDLHMSNASISNLKLLNFGNTGSGWNPAIGADSNSSLKLKNAEISGSTDGALVSISEGSVTEIRDSTLTITSGEQGLSVYGSSHLNFRNSTISGSVTYNLVSISEGSSAEIQHQSTLTITSGELGLRVAGSSRLNFQKSTISGSVIGALVDVYEGSSVDIQDQSTLTITSGAQGLRVAGSSRLKFRDSTISGTVTDGDLVSVEAGSSAAVRDATLTLENGNRALGVSRSSELWIRNSKISGMATVELVNVSRLSNAIISNETTLSQTGSDTPDVSVSNLSMLSIWNKESPINSVNCFSKGYVSANEGMVTDLATSCTE